MDKYYDLDPNKIVGALQNLIIEIDLKYDELKKLGRVKANKTRTFNKTFAVQQLMLKNKGMPVTILKAQTLGHDNISMNKFNMDVAESDFLACREALRAKGEIIGTYRSFLTWLRMEYKGQNVPRFHP